MTLRIFTSSLVFWCQEMEIKLCYKNTKTMWVGKGFILLPQKDSHLERYQVKNKHLKCGHVLFSLVTQSLEPLTLSHSFHFYKILKPRILSELCTSKFNFWLSVIRTHRWKFTGMNYIALQWRWTYTLLERDLF
jgi:hypothetical protein